MEDALEATKAAVEEGILPGGGVALLNASKALDKLQLDGDQQLGIKILKKALEAPTKQLAENAGYEGNIVVEKIKSMKDGTGFDVMNGEYVDMMKAGIIDPTKVTKSAVLNSVSVAGMMLTTGALVAQIEEKENKMPPMPPPEY